MPAARGAGLVVRLNQRVASVTARHADPSKPRLVFNSGVHKLAFMQAKEYNAVLHHVLLLFFIIFIMLGPAAVRKTR